MSYELFDVKYAYFVLKYRLSNLKNKLMLNGRKSCSNIQKIKIGGYMKKLSFIAMIFLLLPVTVFSEEPTGAKARVSKMDFTRYSGFGYRY